MAAPHIILFPFMAQGHQIPFIALARLLADERRLTVTVVSTPANIQSIRSTLLPPSSAVRLSSLPFNGPEHGLPPGRESTDTLPFPLILRLLEAAAGLQPSFHRLVSDIAREEGGRRPICIISDFFLGWTVEVARAHGAFHSVFITSGAFGSAVMFTLWIHLPHTKAAGDCFPLPCGFPEEMRIHRSQLANHLVVADGSDPWSKAIATQMSLSLISQGFLFNTMAEMEKAGLEHFKRMANERPCWAIGPLTSELRKKGGECAGGGASAGEDCLSWLSLHPTSSVLFVAFGSQNTISPSQMMDLAAVLEESGRPFIWAVRPPVGNDIYGEFRDDFLPEEFEGRVGRKKMGLLVRNWAPQVEILSHPSTGAFLSHCGWNSTLESLGRGVPMIGWPLSGEQPFNVMMMEELEVCVEVARGNRGEIEKERVKEGIETVMGKTEKGERMRRKASEVMEVMKAAHREEGGFRGSSVRAMDAFIDAVSAAWKNE